MGQIKIDQFSTRNVSWFSVELYWKISVPEDSPSPRVTVTEVTELDGSHTVYRGRKRCVKQTGLKPRTLYNYKLSVEPGAVTNVGETTDETDAAEDTSCSDVENCIPDTDAKDAKSDVTHDVVEATTSFTTMRCGEHDANLVTAIQDHDLIGVREICRKTPEVINIVDKTANSPIMLACQRGYPSILRILYDHGGNLNYSNPSGKTALMLAAYYGNCHVIPTLMELGCDWSVKDNAGCTAMHYAIERGDIEMCTVLREWGVDINSEDSRGSSGLFNLCLADREELEMIEFLVRCEEDIDRTTDTGETPLMAAARTGKAEVVQFLIDSGANIHSKTRYGYTALQMCSEGSACEEILLQYPELVDSDDD